MDVINSPPAIVKRNYKGNQKVEKEDPKSKCFLIKLYTFQQPNSYPQCALIRVKMVIFDSLSIR